MTNLNKRFCNVPDRNNVHLARGLCNKHYCVWKNIQTDYDYVSRYVEEKITPIKSCNCERTGSNLKETKNGRGYPSYKCRKCVNKRQREHNKKLKEEKT